MHECTFTRRRFLSGAAPLAALALAGCVTPKSPEPPPAEEASRPRIPPGLRAYYGPRPDEPYPVPAVDLDRVAPRFLKTLVDDPTGEPPGSVVVDTPERFLYHVMEGGRAVRYGVGIGRDGFAWDGRAVIAYKRKWPTWTPPADMIDREPKLVEYRNGMAPGLDNPLGARALYIHEDGRDTLYRLHGTMQEWSIGKAVSSGCVRLLSQDVIDLYENVRDGSPILVLQ